MPTHHRSGCFLLSVRCNPSSYMLALASFFNQEVHMLASTSICRETHTNNMISTAALSQVHTYAGRRIESMRATSTIKRMKVHKMYVCHGCIERVCMEVHSAYNTLCDLESCHGAGRPIVLFCSITMTFQNYCFTRYLKINPCKSAIYLRCPNLNGFILRRVEITYLT